MTRSKQAESPYFVSDLAVAAYLDMTLPDFLHLRNCGKFSPTPKPRDSTPVYYREDVDWWLENGRPVAHLDRTIR